MLLISILLLPEWKNIIIEVSIFICYHLHFKLLIIILIKMEQEQVELEPINTVNSYVAVAEVEEVA